MNENSNKHELDFASLTWEQEMPEIRVGIVTFKQTQFKILLNPTDQKRALRLIVRTNSPHALDRTFSRVSVEIHIGQSIANVVCCRMLELCGAKNVNVRSEGNNKFAKKSEREGLHYHIFGRFENEANILDTFKIDYEHGVSGDIPIGEHSIGGKKPLAQDKEENSKLLCKLRDKLKLILMEAAKQIQFENKDIQFEILTK